jgi:tRNA modification GTPase
VVEAGTMDRSGTEIVDTIVSIATAVGPGAVGIVRVSGPNALAVADVLWKSRNNPVDKLASHRTYYGCIVDNSSDSVIDEAVAIYFAGPHSFTGEDVVELQCHGNPLLLDRVVELAQRAGARLAEPGEFTRRAFINGRIDLTQAEAIADVIAASSDAGLRAAQEQLRGRLSTTIAADLTELTQLRAFVEATIDFPEEDIEFLHRENIAQRVGALRVRLERLSATYRTGRLYRDGARVVLIGPPNAGKSSLLNALLGEDRALVHPLAGTTRDTIEEVMTCEGIVLRLTDTAGLRALADDGAHAEIESLGIARARELIESADLRLVVLDESAPLTPAVGEMLASLPRERIILWRNKCDRVSHKVPPTSKVGGTLFPDAPTLAGSALTGEGIEALRAALVAHARGGAPACAEGVTITTRRHKEALDEAIVALCEGETALAATPSPEFLAEHLRRASQALGRVVGTVTTEDLLGEIFSRFCIGK